MTKIKICGLTDPGHVHTALELRVDFLGLVFAPSRRQVSPELAITLSQEAHRLEPRPGVVGVFVNLPAAEVNQIADSCRLDWVQLSGEESWKYCREIKRPVIKVIRITEESASGEVRAEIEMGSRLLGPDRLICLLDTAIEGSHGGTGRSFNWGVAGDVSRKHPVMVAGGLTPENVGRLVTEITPWGVDVSSGVETNGVKSSSKMRAFVEAVREADSKLSAIRGSQGKE